MSQTLVINFYGGPGIGKSTMAAALFYELKKLGENVELVQEFAKDLTWEERHNTLANQPYILGKQYHRMMRLVGKVDYIINDSPLPISIYYNQGKLKHFNDLAFELYQQFENLDFLLNYL